jgi:hypothetical protein
VYAKASKYEAKSGLPSADLWRDAHRSGVCVWTRSAAVCALVGALAAGVAGAGCLAMGWAATPAWSGALALVGDGLLFAVIPLLLVGAYLLDAIEDAITRLDAAAEDVGAPSGRAARPVRAHP